MYHNDQEQKKNLQILSSLSTECRRKQNMQNDDTRPIDDMWKSNQISVIFKMCHLLYYRIN